MPSENTYYSNRLEALISTNLYIKYRLVKEFRCEYRTRKLAKFWRRSRNIMRNVNGDKASCPTLSVYRSRATRKLFTQSKNIVLLVETLLQFLNSFFILVNNSTTDVYTNTGSV